MVSPMFGGGLKLRILVLMLDTIRISFFRRMLAANTILDP